MSEEGDTLSEVLFETRHHSSRPCFPNYPPRLINDNNNANRSVLSSLLSTRGLTQLKEKLGYRQAKKLKRSLSLFVSPKGERVAVAVGNYVTILRKDDDYEEPCGTFISNDVNGFKLGAWSESHDVLGIVDDMDTMYFIKSNGEELTKIEKWHLKGSLQIVGLFAPDGSEGSVLCNFNFVTSDGALHQIEISEDSGSSLSSMRTRSDVKSQFPLKFFCSDYNVEHSLLVLVGCGSSLTAGSNTGSCSISVWHWRQNSDMQKLSSTQFEGTNINLQSFGGQVVPPKVLISPHGKFIGALDLKGCLNIFRLNDDRSSISLFVYAEAGYSTATDNTCSADKKFLVDVVDFIWWSDHVCTIAGRGGATTMFDVITCRRLQNNDLMFSLPVLGRTISSLGKVFVLDVPLVREISHNNSEISYVHDIKRCIEGNTDQAEILRLSWRLLSLSERSVPEMYEVLINSQNYQSALEFADRHKMDKDQVFKSQWLHSERGTADIHMFLSNIKDEAFVLGECVEKVGHTEDAVRALLAHGLNLTNRYNFPHSECNTNNHVWDFRLSRLQLLLFRDRLETFLGINMGRFSVQEYCKFRSMPVNEAAVKLAENGKIGALNLLFKRHPFSMSPFILNILAAVPETIPVQTYSQLLPGRSPPPPSTALREKDWVECEDMVEYIRNLPETDARYMLIRTEPLIKQFSGICWPSTDEILLWYKDRAREIDKFSGQLENSICLLEYGCRKGMHELQQFVDDVSYLQQLIYCEGSDDEVHYPISLIEWEHMSDYEKFRIMLKGVKEENIIETLRVRAIPFMHIKCHSSKSMDGQHQSDESFLVRWLKDVAALNNIEFCSMVIDEWCRDAQSGLFANEVEAVDCALQCIYLCSATDQWNTMASILSKLPNTRGIESHEGLEKRLKLAAGHIEAGRLLALYQVPKPVNFFLGAHNDDKAVKQILRLILSKFARRQPGRSDNDWANMWRDLQCLQEKAFPFLDLEYMLMEFCRGLLKGGRFSLARNYLKGTGPVSLPAEKAESLVIQTAREYFFSASSLSSSEIWKAKDCLDLFPSSPNVRLEADIIDALAVKLPNLGVNLLPMQYKQIKDPMEIIKMAITSHAGAYLNVDELIEVAKLLGLSTQEDISVVQEAIAREAAVAGDLQLAFDLCVVLARKGYGIVWDLCAAIARGPDIDNMDLNARKQLLSFALCHCDNESIGDLLHAWKDIDLKAQSESLMMLTGTTPYFAEDQDTHFALVKDILSKVAKDLPMANGETWDNFLRENGKVLSFANMQLPWLFELCCNSEFGKTLRPESVPGRHYVSVRTQAVIAILSWLARNGFSPRDEMISYLAKSIMEPPVTEEEDVIGSAFLLNLIDAFHGVEVIENQLKTREDYQETCSIMNVGMTYSLLHNSGVTCNDPLQRRELLYRKFQEKISSGELENVDKAQSTFWRDWKQKLEEQKRTADRTKVLEEFIPGVETVRFLSGDVHYMNGVVMSLIESVKWQNKCILRDMIRLADTYSLNRTEVLLKFLSCILVSEAWSNEEIDAEISEFKYEILDYAAQTIELLISDVYPAVDGCNKTRLAFIFALLSDCYLILEEAKGIQPSVIQNQATSLEMRGHFYRTVEQECYRVSFIIDLNFKSIVDINNGSLNLIHFNDEIRRHVNESTVEVLAKLVETLVSIVTGATRKDLLSWHDVYRLHVETSLKNLEIRAENYNLQNPETLQTLLNEYDQTYCACRKYIRILEHEDALLIMNQFFNGIIVLRALGKSMHSDPTAKDCLLVLLNFWLRLIDDMLEIAESSEQKLTATCLMACLKVFMRLVIEGKVTPSQGWSTVNHCATCGLLTSPAEEFSLCRSMVLAGCGIGSAEAVFSEAKCSLLRTLNTDTEGGTGCFPDIWDLYLNILESTLSNLANDYSRRQSLQNLLSSLSRLEGDLETLKKVRTGVWENIARFSDNQQLPSYVRVYILEVMQLILGKNVKVSPEQDDYVLPWENWDEWSCKGWSSDLTEEHGVSNQSDASNRFNNTLVALRTTELAASISSHLEITADDLLTVDSAASCFLKFCEVSERHSHLEALMAILEEWGSLFPVEKTTETSVESLGTSDTANNWSDDWDEGWDSFHDEEPVQKGDNESSHLIHPLHTCWLEILKKFTRLSLLDEAVRLIDRYLERPNVVLIDEDDARNLCNRVIDSDCFMALRIALLLPYEAIQLRCLNAVEEKLKQGGFPESKGDKDFLILVMSSGIVRSIISKPAFGATFSYLCYLVGNYSRRCQNALLSRINQCPKDEEEEGFYLTFRSVLFPCFVSELVNADQQVLAGFLVTKFMHTNPSLCLINVAEAALRQYLQNHLQILEGRASPDAREPEILRHTLSNLVVKLRTLIQSALSLLPRSS